MGHPPTSRPAIGCRPPDPQDGQSCSLPDRPAHPARLACACVPRCAIRLFRVPLYRRNRAVPFALTRLRCGSQRWVEKAAHNLALYSACPAIFLHASSSVCVLLILVTHSSSGAQIALAAPLQRTASFSAPSRRPRILVLHAPFFIPYLLYRRNPSP